MKNFDALFSLVRVNWLFLFISLIACVHFIYSYYRHCYSKGFRVDFWHTYIFIIFFFPTFVIYPFSSSELNFFATGEDIFLIQSYINQAFLIFLIGYISLYLGFHYYNIRHYKGILLSLGLKINQIGSSHFYRTLKSKTSLLTIANLGIILASLIIPILYKKYGFSFSWRDKMLADPEMKPLFNFFFTSYAPITASFLGVRYLEYKEKSILIFLITYLGLTFLSGARGVFLSIFLLLGSLYAIKKRRKIKYIKIFSFMFFLLISALLLGSLRSGSFSINQVLLEIGLSVFYGNNFSDLRDLAWVLSYWENKFLIGKTFLAGFISFIPRFLSEFRDEWAIGVFTAKALGLDPKEHPGVRPGPFGEAYLNFSWLGVILLGFISGYLMKFIDSAMKLKAHETKDTYIKMYSVSFIFLFLQNFFNTSGFWRFYILIFMLILAYLSRQIISFAYKKTPPLLKS